MGYQISIYLMIFFLCLCVKKSLGVERSDGVMVRLAHHKWREKSRRREKERLIRKDSDKVTERLRDEEKWRQGEMVRAKESELSEECDKCCFGSFKKNGEIWVIKFLFA